MFSIWPSLNTIRMAFTNAKPLGGNERYVSVSRAEFKKIMSGEGRVELQQNVLPLGVPEETQ